MFYIAQAYSRFVVIRTVLKGLKGVTFSLSSLGYRTIYSLNHPNNFPWYRFLYGLLDIIHGK